MGAAQARALALLQPAAQSSSKAGGHDDLAWAWLGEHPRMLPHVLHIWGAARTEPPLPCGFLSWWEQGAELLFLLQVLPLSNPY